MSAREVVSSWPSPRTRVPLEASVSGRDFVDAAVAVVIDPVDELSGAGVDAAVGVEAVGAVVDVDAAVAVGGGCFARGLAVGEVAVAVAVGVVVPRGSADDAGISVIDQAVAVVVEVVADFARAGVDPIACVVAVRCIADVAHGLVTLADVRPHVAVGIRIRVLVPDRGVHRALVHTAVAVVVLAVAELAGARVDAGVGVVTLLTLGVAIAVTVHRVSGPVAVGIDAQLANGGGAGVVGPVVVVAVRAVADVAAVGIGSRGVAREGRSPRAEGVSVTIVVPRRLAADAGVSIVGQDVAVVVDPVADFARARVDARVRVVAVGRVAHVAGRSSAVAAHGVGHVPVAVTVRVTVPLGGVRGCDVDKRVAVVVEPVADLCCAGEDDVVRVVAIAVTAGVAVAVVIGLVQSAVAIGVHVELAERLGAGVNVPAGVVAVVDRGQSNVAFRRAALVLRVGSEGVGIAVAVHVSVVRLAVRDGVRGVVAVARGFHPTVREGCHVRRGCLDRDIAAQTVAILVQVPGGPVDVPIAIVVHVVDGLRCTRVSGDLGVVAIRARRDVYSRGG